MCVLFFGDAIYVPKTLSSYPAVCVRSFTVLSTENLVMCTNDNGLWCVGFLDLFSFFFFLQFCMYVVCGWFVNNIPSIYRTFCTNELVYFSHAY